MPLTQQALRSTQAVSLDRELEALQDAVSRARTTSWHNDDVIEPEFENFLAHLTGPKVIDFEERIQPNPSWRNRRNSWQFVLDEVDGR